MAYLEKPKGYWYWFKKVVRICFPMKKDFYGLGDALWEAICKATHAILKLLSRALLLITFPISVPILAVVFRRENKRVMLHRAKWLSEEYNGMPPEFTKEQAQSVLDGEKTYEDLKKENEAKWNS